MRAWLSSGACIYFGFTPGVDGLAWKKSSELGIGKQRETVAPQGPKFKPLRLAKTLKQSYDWIKA